MHSAVPKRHCAGIIPCNTAVCAVKSAFTLPLMAFWLFLWCLAVHPFALNIGRALLVCSLPCHASARNRDSRIRVSFALLRHTAPFSKQTFAAARPGTVSARLGRVLGRRTIPGQCAWLCRPRPLLWVLSQTASRAQQRLEASGFGTSPHQGTKWECLRQTTCIAPFWELVHVKEKKITAFGHSISAECLYFRSGHHIQMVKYRNCYISIQ